jgi:hypothetical protein
MDVERFSLKKLTEGEAEEQYHVTVTKKFAALENLEYKGDINRAWDTIRENMKISAKECLCYYESKYHKLWLCEECSEGSRPNCSGCRTQVKSMEIT